jgi:tRNA 2-thiouridine synthesizing protein E
MHTVLKDLTTLQFDEDGFLVDPLSWTPGVAAGIAARDGLPELKSEHWEVIGYLRDHYLRFGSLPVMSHVCRVNHLDRNCVHDLFHAPKEAWRIAGLPNPGEEAKAYM